ncbi:MAG: permease [Desulfarculaceae bacterium]
MNQDWYQTLQFFSQVAVAIFIEAAPFLLLGALISSVMEVYLDQERLARLLPRNRVLGVAVGLAAGMVLPTCECGVVPVARRLLDKGVPPAAALTYMLSAPVINPVVLASTFVAFRYDIWMVLARVVLVAIPAVVLGWTLGEIPSRVLLRQKPQPNHNHHGHYSHDPSPLPLNAIHAHACTCASCQPAHGRALSRPIQVVSHTASEFLDMGKFLVLGALAAAFFKTFLPWEAVNMFQGNPYLAVALMMLLAVLLSVCSEADAFVAASFTTFPAAAQLSFVALGPMLDLKLIGMYFSAFHRRVALALILAPLLIIYPGSIFLGNLLR